MATIAGEAAAGQVSVHRVAYATQGSQNEATLTWEGQSAADGPRLAVYATTVDCTDFRVTGDAASGSCPILGRAGASGDVIVSSLTVTHGRGNPEILGTPAEYLLWVVGDSRRSARYTIHMTWFYGPDC